MAPFPRVKRQAQGVSIHDACERRQRHRLFWKAAMTYPEGAARVSTDVRRRKLQRRPKGITETSCRSQVEKGQRKGSSQLAPQQMPRQTEQCSSSARTCQDGQSPCFYFAAVPFRHGQARFNQHTKSHMLAHGATNGATHA